MEYDADPSERLVDAALRGDLEVAVDCLADELVDVNYAGAVLIGLRSAEIVLHDESATEVRFDYHEFHTDASPLFLAAHAGDLPLLRKLLSAGADVNQKQFRGYATTAAAREGRAEVVEILLKAGAAQPACEDTLAEACRHGQVRAVELILESELVRPRAAAHALVTAASRGFVDVVAALVRNGVDVNAMDRVLLQSLKPSLHANVDCTAIVAAIVNRHVPVVHRLLQAGARTDIPVRLGAWSWDPVTGEEFRVGAGLAEPYTAPWCAVEYFEHTGEILRLLLKHSSVKSLHHLGRSLRHHAILCSSGAALDVLLAHGIDLELDEKARALVLGGGKMRKHRKQGRGAPHTKMVRMDGEMGVLTWGKTKGRSVICRRAELGGSLEFQMRRRKKGGGMEKGLFRVVTVTGKEVHFVCDGGDQAAELWVRGIRLVTKDVFGRRGGRGGMSCPVRKKMCACIHS
ncbi:hypothetical protein KSP39_PZI015849 [Platanthera zijinensis]|uniref:Ankyrin repeat protein n=1 Tax=Platanthera zijinensis TaxID=2320716 RepID=A0AAP0G1Z0_9ASPA